MQRIESARLDDLILAGLLLLIGIPRVVLAVAFDRAFDVEDTLAIICVVLGLLMIVRRRRG